MEGIKKNQD